MRPKYRGFLLLFFTLSLISSLFNFSENIQFSKPRYGGTIRIKSFANIFRKSLDPASSESFRFISEQLYDGLVQLDKNLNITPCLAEYWEISPDGKKYTFYLRKGVRFHHRKELTAEDVVFSFKRILTLKPTSPYHQLFVSKIVGAQEYLSGKADGVSGLKVKDKYAFEVEWKTPFVPALYLFSMPTWKILPEDLLKKEGKDFFNKPSGTGPFQFDYWLRDTRLNIVGVRLKRNDSYFLGKPYLDAIEFSPHYTLDHFLNGEIDIIPVVSEKLLKGNYPVVGIDQLKFTFLGFSCRRAPFNNKKLRKAFSQIINKKNLVQLFYRIHTVPQITNNYIPPHLPGFFPKETEENHNTEEVKTLFDRTFPVKNDSLVITLFCSASDRVLARKVYRELKNQFNFLNIKLRLKTYKSREEIKKNKDPYIIIVSRSMDFPEPDDIIIPLFYSKSNFNLFEYNNPKIDALIGQTQMETSWTKRIEMFNLIEDILKEEVPAIPLFYYQQRVALQDYVRGGEVSPLGFGTLNIREIWLAK
ncbi:MAG: ABC transporter substrate-binding protein [Candidatus Aminicenantia bacterium]